MYLYMLNMSLNHQCVIDSENQQQLQMIGAYQLLKYTGQSPDEITLIEAASSLGFQFLGVERGIAKLKLFNSRLMEFQLLFNFEFDSDRKRSTVIIKQLQDNKDDQYIMLIKGADNVIKDIMSLPNSYLRHIDIFLDDFSKSGLRTLCFGYKILTQQQFTLFNEKYNQLYS